MERRIGAQSCKSFFSSAYSSLRIYAFWTDYGTACKQISCKRTKPIFKDPHASELAAMTSQFHPRASPVVLENYESQNAPQRRGPKLLAQLSRRAAARLPWNQEDTLSPARHAAGIRAAPAGTCSLVRWECPLRNVGRRLGAEAARVRVRSARAGRPGHRSGSWAPVGFAAEAVRVFRAEGRGEVRREERGRAGRSGRGRASGARCRLRRAGRRPRVRRGAAGAV